MTVDDMRSYILKLYATIRERPRDPAFSSVRELGLAQCHAAWHAVIAKKLDAAEQEIEEIKKTLLDLQRAEVR